MVEESQAAAADVAADAENIVTIRGLDYGVAQREIFRDLNVIIRRGRVTAIMGPSGTGKTTLLRLITGQIIAGSRQRHRRRQGP